MNKIQRIQKLFHTDKWWGRVIFTSFFYLLFFIIWFNIFIPSMIDGIKIFFDFNLFPVKLSFLFFTTPISEIIKYPISIFNIQIYFTVIMPILSFIFLKKFIFKVLSINLKIVRYFLYILNFLFILILMRVFILSIISNIKPNFF